MSDSHRSSDIRILGPDGMTLLGTVSVATREYRDARGKLKGVLPDPFTAKASVDGPSVARQGARHGYARQTGRTMAEEFGEGEA